MLMKIFFLLIICNLKPGEILNQNNPDDKKAVVLSEEAVKLLGINDPEKALNQMISNYR